MLRKWFVFFILLFFIAPSFSLAGSFGKGDPSGVPGQWYVGTTPTYVAPSKHPILFVHGLNSSSNTWWENNNMYDTAYQNGYETAFIDLYPTKNMWDNGYLLAQKIKEISNYFGEKVVVVAHSKGGIDTQSALVHYGAYPYVARVITLSSPHYGSQLADLAYSGGASWLAGIIGSKNDATYSLQTGYMSYFRSQTDNHANRSKTPFYTFAGTKWGSFGSSLYWGGLYLRAYGSNDGAVTVKNSRLPYATELKVGDWNHSTIKEGSSTFALFKNYLNESVISSTAMFQAQSVDTVAATDEPMGSYVAGGEYSGTKKEAFHVENGVREITVDWISDQPATALTLSGPDGKKQTAFTTENDDTEYFDGAYHHTITIPNPTSGEWTIQASSTQTERYLLNVSFDSPLDALLDATLANGEVKMNVKDQKLNMTSDMTIEYYKDGKLKQSKVRVNKKNATFKLPKLGEGVYNMTINITGKQGKHPFHRTIVKSVFVDGAGNVYGQ